MNPNSDERMVLSGQARLWSTVSGAGTPVVFFNGGQAATIIWSRLRA